MFILEAIGFVLLGLAVVVGAVLGPAYLLAREINRGGHGPGCPCPACQQMRLKQWQAREQAPVNPPSKPIGKDRQSLPSRSHWLSTAELRPGMSVHGKTGVVFRVDAVTPIPYGYMVVLVNPLTSSVSRIPVSADDATKKIWLTRKPKEG